MGKGKALVGMGYMHKTLKFIFNGDYRWYVLACRGFFHSWEDERYIKKRYRACMGQELNLDAPQTFSEKLQWLKLYDRRPEYTTMADKYAAKEYVAGIIGREYIIPTLGVWDRFDEIDFDSLPGQFVLKTTHDSGGVVICRDKDRLDIRAARKKLSRSLRQNYFYLGREWPYKDVRPRIIAEQYIVGGTGEACPNDYKFMCFNGKVKCIFVCTGRYSTEGVKITVLDAGWNILPFRRYGHKREKAVLKPRNLGKMIMLSEKLSKNIPFIRVDFYEIDGRIYFSELTFYPASGFEPFDPESADRELGGWLKLPVKNVV